MSLSVDACQPFALTWPEGGGGLAATTPVRVMPVSSACLDGTVRLDASAELRITLRDELAEQARIVQTIGQIAERARSRGHSIRSCSVDWRFYPGTEGQAQASIAVVVLTLGDGTRENRRTVLRDLMDYLADHEDPVVRGRISIRIR